MENAWFGYCPCGWVAGDNAYGVCDDCNEMICLEDDHNLNHVDSVVDVDYLP